MDSTLYTTSGVLRTMELILGIPPMSQYDAAAAPIDLLYLRPSLEVRAAAGDPDARRRLRATPETASTPVIMLTARGDEVDRILGHAPVGRQLAACDRDDAAGLAGDKMAP